MLLSKHERRIERSNRRRIERSNRRRIERSNIDEDVIKQEQQTPTKRKSKAEVKAAILDALADEPKASQDLAIMAGYSTHRSGAYLRIINELMAENKIAFTNPDNPQDKNQKISLHPHAK